MRILGINIPDEKKLEYSLTYIFGVGLSRSREIIKAAGLDPSLRTKELKQDDLSKIQKVLEGAYRVEGELRQDIKQNINRLKNISAYRGSRHAHHLPTRGQRTRRNTRTVRGNVRNTVGSGRRKVELK